MPAKASGGSGTKDGYTISVHTAYRPLLPSSDSDFVKRLELIDSDSSVSTYVVLAHDDGYEIVSHSSMNFYLYIVSGDRIRFCRRAAVNTTTYDGYFKEKYSLNGDFVERTSHPSSYFHIYLGSYNLKMIYWKNLLFKSDVLEFLNLSSLVSSFPYAGADVSGRDTSIPIDDIYAGDDAARRKPPIDNIADDDVYINSGSIDDFSKGLASVIDGVGAADNVGSKADALTGGLTDVYDKTVSDTKTEAGEAVQDVADVNLGNTSVSFSADDFKVSGLGGKFPFCIPFDIVNLMKSLVADREAPCFVFPFSAPALGIDEEITIDLSLFEPVAKVARTVEVVGFVVFLTVKTRQFVKG